MADENVCADCQIVFPTSRGLAIHAARKHGGSLDPTADRPFIDPAAKDKFLRSVGKFKFSFLANLYLGRLAREYGDENIRLTPQEASDIDGVIQDAMAEYGTGDKTLKQISPFLPAIALCGIVLPIAFDKMDRINTARENSGGNSVRKPPPKPDNSGLTRADVQPDSAGGDETPEYPEIPNGAQ